MNTEAVAHYIAEWMSGYLDGTGAAGFVVGVSGGIDSAVVSTLAAMTGRRTLCVTLPIHQAQAQVDRAGEHVRRLTERYSNAEAAHADLTAAYDAFAGSFAPSLVQGAGKGVADLAGANARSRLRMTALYYFAGLNNLLVAGTGNKIEDFGVGFFTKYGEVYELGRWLRVPEAILVAPPTDGLFGDDRTDEQQIGATYPELERAMAHAERGTDPALLSGREREVYDIFLRRNRANRHKMEPIPVCRIPRYLVEPAGR